MNAFFLFMRVFTDVMRGGGDEQRELRKRNLTKEIIFTQLLVQQNAFLVKKIRFFF